MKTQSLHNQLVEWRHDLHMHPQLSFEEEYAAAKVSTLLKRVWNRSAFWYCQNWSSWNFKKRK